MKIIRIATDLGRISINTDTISRVLDNPVRVVFIDGSIQAISTSLSFDVVDALLFPKSEDPQFGVITLPLSFALPKIKSKPKRIDKKKPKRKKK